MTFLRAVNKRGDGVLWKNFFPELKWDSESYKEELRNDILSWGKSDDIKPHKLRVLVFGVTGQGKSCTLNSWVSCLCKEIRQASHSAKVDFSVSLTVRNIHPLDDGTDVYFEFLDMPGLTNLEDEDLRDVIYGHIPPGTELIEKGKKDKDGKSGSVRARTPQRIVEQPHLLDRPHVVVLVSTAGKVVPEPTREKIKVVHEAAGRAHVRVALILSHTDLLSGVNNVTKLSYSREVQEAMTLANNDFGLTMNRIFPVINFVHERTVNLNMSICLLYALKSILGDAKGEAEKRLKEMEK